MHETHIGNAALAACWRLNQGGALPMLAEKVAIESFSSDLHTSLLDLAERKLGLFFWVWGILFNCPSNHQFIAPFGQKSSISGRGC